MEYIEVISSVTIGSDVIGVDICISGTELDFVLVNDDVSVRIVSVREFEFNTSWVGPIRTGIVELLSNVWIISWYDEGLSKMLKDFLCDGIIKLDFVDIVAVFVTSTAAVAGTVVGTSLSELEDTGESPKEELNSIRG